MRTQNLPVLGVSLLWFLGLQAGAAEERPVLTIPRCAAPPVVDGRVAQGEYDRATAFTGFQLAGSRLATHRSALTYITHDGQRLYIAVVSSLRDGERLRQLVSRRDYSKVCMDDAIEIFIYPARGPGEMQDYYQFVLNARGAYYDARFTPDNGQVEPQWNGRWEQQSTVSAEYWTVEVSVPLEDFSILPHADGIQLDLDVCRDSPSFTRHFTSFAGAFHRRELAARAVLTQAGPAVQITSLGDLCSGSVDVRGSVRDADWATADIVAEAEVRVGGAEVFAQRLPCERTEKGTAGFRFTHALDGAEEGQVRVRVWDRATDTTYFSQCLRFQTGVPDKPVQKLSQPLVLVDAKVAPSYGRIQVDVDIHNLAQTADVAKVALNIVRRPQGTSMARAEIDHSGFQRDFASVVLDVPGLREGEYECLLTARDAAGATLATTSEKLQIKTYPWLGNNIGKTDKPMRPWTALEVDGNTVSCWGRRYVLDGTGLPAQIQSTQPTPTRGPETVPLLSRPARVAVVAGGRAVPFTPGRLRVLEHTSQLVKVQGDAVSDLLRLRAVGEIEYDGFCKIDLTVEPTQQTAAVDEVAVEFPLDSRWVGLMNAIGDMVRGSERCGALPDGDGRLWDSTMHSNMLVKGNFLPFVWLGNEDRGLAYLADNDRGWSLDDTKPCLEIVRRAGETTFRIVFINTPVTLRQPVTIRFGIQATPVKPLPNGWRAWQRATTTFERSMHWEWPTKEWPPGSKFHTYSSNASGRQAKPQYIGTVHPTDEEASRKYVETHRQQGLNVTLYLNLNKTGGADQAYKDFAAEWCRIPDGPGYYSPVASYQDYALWCLQKWITSCNLDGLYMDDVFPTPSENTINGCGWVDEQGIVHAGYSLFAARDYMKRLAAMLHALGPAKTFRVHTTNTPCTPYLGFADMFFDCELHGNPDPDIKNPDYIDRWPYERLDRFRAASYTKQFGLVPTRLVKSIDRKLDANSAAALVLLHDIFWFTADHTYFVWPLSQFRIWADDLEFFPYWDIRLPVALKTSNHKVLASVWKRTDRALIIVSNLGETDAVVNVDMDLNALGLRPSDLAATDGITQQPLALAGHSLQSLRVNRHDYVLAMLAAPGVFSPGDDVFGRELPLLATVLEQSRDFTGALPERWQTVLSPDNARGSVGTWNDRLKVVTRKSRYALASRPFGLDNVSVQVCIEIESQDNNNTLYGPALALYWEDGSYVKAGLALNAPAFKDKAPKYMYHANQRRITGPSLPMKRETYLLWKNWVKIALSPESIEFWCSTDGTTWTKVGSQPRKKDFKGAPVKLILGCGHGAKRDGFEHDGLMNDRQGRTDDDHRFYYFRDLIIGRE